MKRKQVMTKIAALALAAMMTATVVPAAAVPAFAATEATDTVFSVDPGTLTADSTADAIQSVVVTAMDLSKPVLKEWSVTEKPGLNSDNTVNYGVIEGTIEWAGDEGATKEQNFKIKLNALSNNGKIAVAKAVVAKAFTDKTYTAAKKVNASDVFKDAQTAIDDFNKANNSVLQDVTASGNVDDVTITEPNGATDGSVKGTITLTAPKTTAYSKATGTVDVTATITTDYQKIDDGKLVPAIEDALKSTGTFYNDVTEEQIEDALSDYIKDKGYLDVTVDVKIISNSTTKANHDGNPEGSIKFSVQLTQGTTNLNIGTYGTAKLIHSPSEAFAEAETNIAAKAADKNTALAKEAASETAPLEKDVLEDANEVVANAFNAKVKLANGKDSTYPLSNDYSTDKDTYSLLKGADNNNYDELVTSETIKYTEPTSTKEGTAVVTVNLKVKNTSYSVTNGALTPDENYTDKTITFTLTYNKLKLVPATKLELGNAVVIYTDSNDPESLNDEEYSYDLKTNYGADIESKDGKTPVPNDITWTSDNSDITVSSDGVVTATNFGTATITAKSATNNLTDTVKVTYAVPNGLFEDVTDAKKYYFSPVYWAKDEGIVYGTSDTMFSPDGSTTRGQMITFLYRYYLKDYGLDSVKATETFDDVKDGDYYQEAVAWAQTNGIAAGVSKTEFAPNQKVTRAQLVTFLYRYAQKFGDSQAYATDEQGEIKFSDVKATAYYATAVKWAADRNIAAGYVDGTFKPNNDCARKDAVSFLYRANYYLGGI